MVRDHLASLRLRAAVCGTALLGAAIAPLGTSAQTDDTEQAGALPAELTELWATDRRVTHGLQVLVHTRLEAGAETPRISLRFDPETLRFRTEPSRIYLADVRIIEEDGRVTLEPAGAQEHPPASLQSLEAALCATEQGGTAVALIEFTVVDDVAVRDGALPKLLTSASDTDRVCVASARVRPIGGSRRVLEKAIESALARRNVR